MTALLVLAGRDLQGLMRFEDYVDAVAEAFRLHAEGGAVAPPPLHIPGENGGFHVKAASLAQGSGYVAVKVNANFPENRRRPGLPTIQGAVLLCDGSNGTPLALLDSIEITLQRTGAATALAARRIARPDSSTATICGCGAQGRVQLMALRRVLGLERAYAWDIDPERAAAYARRMTAALALEVVPVAALREATRKSDVIATCTTASEPFLGLEDVRPGTFIAAIGADNPGKNEIAPWLMAGAAVFADLRAQCAVMGDLHHAIRAGAMTVDDVCAELGDLVAGRERGRRSAEEITIFDSTGTAIQDVAAAARAYERARQRGVGALLELT
jgi:ornithine cyclodeaminase/alanine dehydrogenase-like protein (mu-crystallin family)